MYKSKVMEIYAYVFFEEFYLILLGLIHFKCIFIYGWTEVV